MSEKDEPTTESCLLLLYAIIDRAVKDLRPPRADVKVAREINCYPLAQFFEGAWFEDICGYLELDPDAARAELSEEGWIA